MVVVASRVGMRSSVARVCGCCQRHSAGLRVADFAISRRLGLEGVRCGHWPCVGAGLRGLNTRHRYAVDEIFSAMALTM